MKVMVLCGMSPRHLYVANRLASRLNVVAIVHEQGSAWTVKKLRKMLRPNYFASKVGTWWRRRLIPSFKSEGQFFFGQSPPALDRPELQRLVPHINHDAVVRLARELQPDVIAVFGTSLIRGPLLDAARLGMLNLHGGLSPEYRGADCTFWALYNGEPEKVGCTIHFIDPGIDTGRLIAHVSPEVGPNDDEMVLFWRGVRSSADVYVEAIERLARGEALGRPQPSKGRLYQVKDRSGKHDLDLQRRLADGMLASIRLPLRVTWFATERALPGDQDGVVHQS